MTEAINRLLTDNYTTEQVAQAVGRSVQHWCRIRHKFIVKHKLPVVKLGRRHYYQKEAVDRMIDQLLQNGE